MRRDPNSLLPLVLVVGLGLLAPGCGPMNPKPSSSTSASMAGAAGKCSSIDGEDATGSRKPGYSANHEFLVSAHLKGAAAGAAEKPVQGPNAYVLRLAHGEDLTPVAATVEMTATYFKAPHKPTTHPYNAPAVKQDDGTWIVTPSFQKRSGTFEVHVELTEGEVHDEYVFTVVYAAPAS